MPSRASRWSVNRDAQQRIRIVVLYGQCIGRVTLSGADPDSEAIYGGAIGAAP